MCRLSVSKRAGYGLDTEEHCASLNAGKPGVLHGNRTYLLQDDDGQILEGHSISAGLDYPGIGPEHSFLRDSGRVEYVSATDTEALEAFQLLCQTEGIIPALESSHAIAEVIKRAPTMDKDQIIVVNLSGRGDKDVNTCEQVSRQGPPCGIRAGVKAMEKTRIDTRFAACKAENRAALVGFITAGDPDLDTSLEIFKALPKAGVDVIELGYALLRSDGRRGSYPARHSAGHLPVATPWPRPSIWSVPSARRIMKHTIILMGYYNPIYVRDPKAFVKDAKEAGVDGMIVVDVPPEHDDELCIPAREAGINFIRLATPTTDEKRLPKVLANTSGFVYYVSVTGITGSGALDADKVAIAVNKHKGPHGSTGCCWLWRENASAGRRYRAQRRWCGRRLRARQCHQG